MQSKSDRSVDTHQTLARWQFSLRQLLAVTAGLSVFFSAVAYAGVLGAAVLLGLAGAYLTCAGLWSGRRGPIAIGVTLFVLSLFLGIPLCQVAFWDGSKNVALQFVVVDAAAERPIDGASVRIRDISTGAQYPKLPVPVGERGIEAKTGRDGAVTLTERFPASGRDSPFQHTGKVHFLQEYWLQVSSPGYETLLIPLCECAGKARDIDDCTPPPMRIGLRRAGAFDRLQEDGSGSQHTGKLTH